MADNSNYEEWIADRRAVRPSGDLIDRVMTAVEDRQEQCKPDVYFADRLNDSRPVRWAACVAAMLIGSLPFLLVANVAYLLVF